MLLELPSFALILLLPLHTYAAPVPAQFAADYALGNITQIKVGDSADSFHCSDLVTTPNPHFYMNGSALNITESPAVQAATIATQQYNCTVAAALVCANFTTASYPGTWINQTYGNCWVGAILPKSGTVGPPSLQRCTNEIFGPIINTCVGQPRVFEDNAYVQPNDEGSVNINGGETFGWLYDSRYPAFLVMSKTEAELNIPVPAVALGPTEVQVYPVGHVPADSNYFNPPAKVSTTTVMLSVPTGTTGTGDETSTNTGVGSDGGVTITSASTEASVKEAYVVISKVSRMSKRESLLKTFMRAQDKRQLGASDPSFYNPSSSKNTNSTGPNLGKDTSANGDTTSTNTGVGSNGGNSMMVKNGAPNQPSNSSDSSYQAPSNSQSDGGSTSGGSDSSDSSSSSSSAGDSGDSGSKKAKRQMNAVAHNGFTAATSNSQADPQGDISPSGLDDPSFLNPLAEPPAQNAPATSTSTSGLTPPIQPAANNVAPGHADTGTGGAAVGSSDQGAVGSTGTDASSQNGGNSVGVGDTGEGSSGQVSHTKRQPVSERRDRLLQMRS
ncbi:MAG: hypothetical protein M1827_005313 [Pycnora praestabilis]|nr:MAG: hypothetical protein M1827_005313 [Pycnora praestabilis]